MIKAVIILGLAAIASAQLLRISPAVIGSSSPGQQQVIPLAAGGGLGSGPQQSRPVSSYQPRPVAAYQAQPSSSYQPRPVAAYQAKPVASFQAQPVSAFQAQPVSSFQSQSVSSFQAQPVAAFQAKPVAAYQVQPVSSYQAPKPVASYQSAPVVAAPSSSYSPSSSRYSQEEQSAPTPYSFAYDSEDQYGTKLGRQESANEQGVVTGSYTLSDANGIARIVNYIADAEGFRATVQTNEPGTETSNPANVQIQSSYVAPAQPSQQ